MNTPSHHFARRGAPHLLSPRSNRSLHRTGAPAATLAVLALLATGCATNYKFGVDAITRAQGTLQQQSYRLVDARPDVKAAGPAFERVAHDVRTALSSKGMFEAPEGVEPEVVIEVDYGISAPTVAQHVRVEPVFLMAPRVSGMSVRQGSDPFAATLEPRFFGNREVPFTVTTYEKFLRLTAHEAAAASGSPVGRQVWSVLVSNTDESEDLVGYVRLMVAAAMDSVGHDSGTERRLVLTKRDGRVEFVEKGMNST